MNWRSQILWVGLVWMCAACGGATPAVSDATELPSRADSTPQTVTERIQELHYPTVVRCDFARMRTEMPSLLSRLSTVAHGMDGDQCAASILEGLNEISLAVDVRGSVVGVADLANPSVISCIDEWDTDDEIAQEIVQGSVTAWSRRKPPSQAVRLLIESLAREPMSHDAFCEVHVSSELIRHFGHEIGDVPRPSEPLERMVWDFQFLERWDLEWTNDGLSINNRFSTNAQAGNAGESVRAAIAYAQQAISVLSATLNEPEVQEIVRIVLDIMSRIDVSPSMTRLAVNVPFTVSEIDSIEQRAVTLFQRERARTNISMARFQLDDFSTKVQQWSTAHPRVQRRTVPFPVAPRTNEMSYQEAYANGSSNLQISARWMHDSWQAYGIAPVGSGLAYEITANGDTVVLHAYADSDGNGVFSHSQREGHRNPADGTITWSEITVTDENE